MALLQRQQIQVRANQLVLREANLLLAEHERDLLATENRFKIWKKKIMIKVTLAIIQQNQFRQRLLFRRLEQLNRVSHCFEIHFFHSVCLIDMHFLPVILSFSLFVEELQSASTSLEATRGTSRDGRGRRRGPTGDVVGEDVEVATAK